MGWTFFHSFPDYPPGNDSTVYLTMAKGFAQGTGYHDITSPDPHAGTLQSPSFFPLLLSLYWRLPDPGLLTLKIANALILCLAAIPLFRWLRLFLPAAQSFLVVMAFTGSWVNSYLGNSVMTETVFIPLLYSGLVLSQLGLKEAPITGGPANLMRWAAVLIWVLTARTRVVGLVFWGAYLFLLGRRREWPKVLASLVLIAAWLAWERYLTEGIRVSRYHDGMFTSQYPVLVDIKLGIIKFWTNFRDTFWNWSFGGQAHAMFPWLYYLHPMNKVKRVLCALVFLGVAWGLVLAWRRHRDFRPWIMAAAAANLPTFLIFHPQDMWRYMHAFLPFSCLFLLIALEKAGISLPRLGKARPALAAGLLLAATQFLHNYERDFEDDFIDQSSKFRALHDSLLAGPERPDLILSPDHWYTYLRTGIPSMSDYGRHHRLHHVVPYLKDKEREVWAIRGSANDWYVFPWEKAGMAFLPPPKHVSDQWTIGKVEWQGK